MYCKELSIQQAFEDVKSKVVYYYSFFRGRVEVFIGLSSVHGEVSVIFFSAPPSIINGLFTVTQLPTTAHQTFSIMCMYNCADTPQILVSHQFTNTVYLLLGASAAM